jgi:hypothetical protein
MAIGEGTASLDKALGVLVALRCGAGPKQAAALHRSGKSEHGYTIDDEEITLGARRVAVPIVRRPALMPKGDVHREMMSE